MPIENKMLSSTIESAQKKIESRNFQIRKNLLQFDDVVNRQREIIYGQRGKVLNGEDVSDNIRSMIKDTMKAYVARYLADDVNVDDWNFTGLRDSLLGWITDETDFRYDVNDLNKLTREDIENELLKKAFEKYEAKEKQVTPPIMREMERMVLLRNVDTKWMDHIDALQDLKQGIYLRQYGQHNPVEEYRMESGEMFGEMVESIKEDTVRMLLTLNVRIEEGIKREQIAKPVTAASDSSEKKAPVQKTAKVGRNDLCPCGSGKKYKKCCGREA